MSNQIKQSKITIIADRHSICAADDLSSHKNKFEFDSNTSIEQIIEEVELHREYANFGEAFWAGSYKEYKCIKNGSGKWLTNKSETVMNFFAKIDKYICFERGSKKCN